MGGSFSPRSPTAVALRSLALAELGAAGSGGAGGVAGPTGRGARRVASPPRGLPKRRSQSSGHSPGSLRPLRDVDDAGGGAAVRSSPSTPPQGLSRFARRTVSAPGAGVTPPALPGRRPVANGGLPREGAASPSGAAQSAPLRNGGDGLGSGVAAALEGGLDPVRRVLELEGGVGGGVQAPRTGSGRGPRRPEGPLQAGRDRVGHRQGVAAFRVHRRQSLGGEECGSPRLEVDGAGRHLLQLVRAAGGSPDGVAALRAAALAAGPGRLKQPLPECGHTILHEAVVLGDERACTAILGAGADPNIGHPARGPPLLHAAAWGEKGALRVLLEAGASTTEVDGAGFTALHYACMGGHVACVQALLQAGASIRARTQAGQTPLQLVDSPQVQRLFGKDISGSSIPESPGAASFSKTLQRKFERDYDLEERLIVSSDASSSDAEGGSGAGSPIRAESPPMLQTPRHLKAGYRQAQRYRHAEVSDEWEKRSVGAAVADASNGYSNGRQNWASQLQGPNDARDTTRSRNMFKNSQEMETGAIVWTKGEFLGAGAYGRVFAGLNQRTGELMGVKEIPVDMSDPRYPDKITAMDKEISLYRRLKHKYIIGYIGSHVDYEREVMFVFLEYAPGGSIASMLKRFGSFSDSLVRHYTRQILVGLEHLHRRKIIHRDLKGANILISKEGHVKLADFGASKVFNERTLSDGFKSMYGSIYWMAPEVMKHTGYGRKADIWGVGCVVLEMLTGTHPWPARENHFAAMFEIVKCVTGPPIPEGISADAKSFLDLCFQYDPDSRPTALQLLQHPFVAKSKHILKEEKENFDHMHSL